MRPDRSRLFILAFLPTFLFGCTGNGSIPTASSVTITPATATLPVGSTANFTVKTTGLASAAVTWSVKEGTQGGSITGTGVYTAPNAPGTFHIIATSQTNATRQGTAIVTVQAGSVQGNIQ